MNIFKRLYALMSIFFISTALMAQVSITQGVDQNPRTLNLSGTFTQPVCKAWTPTLIGSTTSPTVTYTSQVGYYCKQGQLVHLEGYIAWSAATGGVGSVRIGGWSAYAPAQTEAPCKIHAISGGFTWSGQVSSWIYSSNVISILTLISGTGTSTVGYAGYTSGTDDVYFSCDFYTAQ